MRKYIHQICFTALMCIALFVQFKLGFDIIVKLMHCTVYVIAMCLMSKVSEAYKKNAKTYDVQGQENVIRKTMCATYICLSAAILFTLLAYKNYKEEVTVEDIKNIQYLWLTFVLGIALIYGRGVSRVCSSYLMKVEDGILKIKKFTGDEVCLKRNVASYAKEYYWIKIFEGTKLVTQFPPDKSFLEKLDEYGIDGF